MARSGDPDIVFRVLKSLWQTGKPLIYPTRSGDPISGQTIGFLGRSGLHEFADVVAIEAGAMSVEGNMALNRQEVFSDEVLKVFKMSFETD